MHILAPAPTLQLFRTQPHPLVVTIWRTPSFLSGIYVCSYGPVRGPGKASFYTSSSTTSLLRCQYVGLDWWEWENQGCGIPWLLTVVSQFDRLTTGWFDLLLRHDRSFDMMGVIFFCFVVYISQSCFYFLLCSLLLFFLPFKSTKFLYAFCTSSLTISSLPPVVNRLSWSGPIYLGHYPQSDQINSTFWHQ